MPTAAEQELARDPARTAGAALRTYFNIVRDWDLNTEQAMTLLGFDERTRSTFFKWKREPESARLSREKLERLSYIFGIYKDLQILLPKAESADQWIHRPNDAPLFGAAPPWSACSPAMWPTCMWSGSTWTHSAAFEASRSRWSLPVYRMHGSPGHPASASSPAAFPRSVCLILLPTRLIWKLCSI